MDKLRNKRLHRSRMSVAEYYSKISCGKVEYIEDKSRNSAVVELIRVHKKRRV